MVNKKRYFRCIPAFLSAVIIAVTCTAPCPTKAAAESVPAQIGATQDTAEEYLTNYSFVAENESAALYADLEKGHIALQNKKSGAFWYSVPNDFLTDEISIGEKRLNIFSEIVIRYVKKSDESTSEDVITLNSHSDCIRNNSVSVERIDGGISVEYNFVSIDTSVTAEYKLTEKGFVASLPLNKIKEGKDAILVNIALLPYFGAGGIADDGYLFVPDGCGALIDFNNQVSTVSGYHSFVYGEELSKHTETKENSSERVYLPVYGIRKNSEALFAVITSGDGMASINAQNGNREMGYNSVWSQAELAVISKMSLYENDWKNRTTISKAARASRSTDTYSVTYTMLSGEDADYVGMAKTYRNYLINEKGLTATQTNTALALSLYGAADKQAYFIGIPYTKTVPLTDFEQAQNILSQLHDSGIDSVSVQYIGWNNSGILNQKLPSKAVPMNKLGGKSGLKQLQDYVNQNDDELYLDIDFNRFRKSGNGYFKNFSATKNAFGYIAKQYEYLSSIYVADNDLEEYLLLSPNKFEKSASDILKSCIKLDVSSVSFSAAGQLCYSDFDEKKGIYRSDVTDIYEKILSLYRAEGMDTVFTKANAYTFAYADRIYSAPNSSSGYYMFDADVPFYQIVLHGYIHLTSQPITSAMDRNKTFLNAVETGSELLFDGIAEDASLLSDTRYDSLYSTTFDLWKDTAVELYSKIETLLKKIAHSTITEHERIGDLARTAYDNGTVVYVNYSDTSVTYDGLDIPAEDFVLSVK